MAIAPYDWNKIKKGPDEHDVNKVQQEKARNQGAEQQTKSLLQQKVAEQLKTTEGVSKISEVKTPKESGETISGKNIGTEVAKPSATEQASAKQILGADSVRAAAENFAKMAKSLQPGSVEHLIPETAVRSAVAVNMPQTESGVVKQVQVLTQQAVRGGKINEPAVRGPSKESEKTKQAQANVDEQVPQEGLEHPVGALQGTIAGGQVKAGADRNAKDETRSTKEDAKKSKRGERGGVAGSGSVYRSDAEKELGELSSGLGSSTTSDSETTVPEGVAEEKPSLFESSIGSQILTESTEGVEKGFPEVYEAHRRLDEKVIQPKLSHYADLNQALERQLRNDLKAIFKVDSLPDRILSMVSQGSDEEVRQALREQLRLPSSPNGRGTIA